MTKGVLEYKDLGWSGMINSASSVASYVSVVDPLAAAGDGVYAEISYVHSGAVIGDGTILSCVEIQDEVIPPDVVLHCLKQTDGKFVARIFGIDDNPKQNRLFGKEIPSSLSSDLWSAPVYPECSSIKEAVRSALDLYDNVMADRWDLIEGGKSLASGFLDADPGAILDWNRRMQELVSMNHLDSMIKTGIPATKLSTLTELTGVQRKWLDDHIAAAGYSEKMRLHYYVGTALKNEVEVAKAFRALSAAILDSTLKSLEENRQARICTDEISVALPLRVNFGGGWSDTPPYCNENGGTVLNAAILLNGKRPVSVKLRRIDEYKIVFDSGDMDVHGEFTQIGLLQSVGDPFDPFVLQKAALLACGVIPKSGGDLETVLSRLGGGFIMDTEVTGVPKGSGLGTSSILAAACVKALFCFLAIPHTESDLYSHVLCMEQIMSTGGGWQDQVGGVTDGIKYITSGPGLKQEIKVQHVVPDQKTLNDLNERFTLIYTGQRRLARNLLRDVVGRYIGNEKDTVSALNEIQRNAALQRFELERGHVDDFAKLLSEHWELSKKIDSGSTNTLIDQIFDSVDDLLAGKMVCGAGGGGFLQVVMKKGVSKEQLQARLKSVFSDTDINVWDCTLV